MSMEKICMIGCGGHAHSVADAFLGRFPDASLKFYDINAKDGETIFSYGKERYCAYALHHIKEEDDDVPIFIAIGDNQERKEYAGKFCNEHNLISVVSISSIVSKFSRTGYENFIGNMAYIGSGANIGNFNIINTSAVVEHEVQVGNFSHISVNTTVCGRSKIGSNVFLGAGSTVIDKISICDNVVVGANSVVVDDINVSGVYVGNPVRMIKRYV